MGDILLYILFAILGIIVLLFLVCLIRALTFKPRAVEEIDGEKPLVDKNQAVEEFKKMLELKTISVTDKENGDYTEHEKFIQLLKDTYPKVFAKFEFEVFDKIGLVFHLKGKTCENPTVLMSHYDVVPVSRDGWDTDPFTPTIIDDKIYARGAIDNKATLLCIMHSMETILEQNSNFLPENDLYFTFGGDEEISGPSQQKIVSVLKERGVKNTFVMDEGGAIVESFFPGLDTKIAVVGLAEKGMANVELTAKSTGGHASTPSKTDPLNMLARALVDLENNPMPLKIPTPIRGLLDTLGRSSKFGLKLVFSNLWLFEGLVKKIFSKGGETRAMLTSTFAYTTIQASNAPNIVPTDATVNLNIRIAPGVTVDDVLAHIKKVINNDQISVNIVVASEASKTSSIENKGYKTIQKIMKKVYSDVLVSPYIMIAASDSRFYDQISDDVVKFAPFSLSKEMRKTVHGHNEHLELSSLVKGIEFYTLLILNS